MINYVRWQPLESSKLVIKWNTEFQWLLPLDQNRTHWIRHRPTTQSWKLAIVVVCVHLCSYTAKVEPSFLFEVVPQPDLSNHDSISTVEFHPSTFNPYNFFPKSYLIIPNSSALKKYVYFDFMLWFCYFIPTYFNILICKYLIQNISTWWDQKHNHYQKRFMIITLLYKYIMKINKKKKIWVYSPKALGRLY